MRVQIDGLNLKQNTFPGYYDEMAVILLVFPLYKIKISYSNFHEEISLYNLKPASLVFY